MKIATVNGISRVSTVNGFSRVSPVNGFSRVSPVNGISRVSLNGIENLSINGYEFNGYEFNDYLENCAYSGEYPTMNGLKDWIARSRERKAARQDRRDRRREARTIRQEMKGDVRAERRDARKGFFRDIGENVRGLIQNKARELGLDASALMDQDIDFANLRLDEQMMTEDEQKLFGLGKPQLFKEPGKWFASNRIPTINKVGVAAAGLLLVDGLTGGNIILKRVGVMKPKRK